MILDFIKLSEVEERLQDKSKMRCLENVLTEILIQLPQYLPNPEEFEAYITYGGVNLILKYGESSMTLQYYSGGLFYSENEIVEIFDSDMKLLWISNTIEDIILFCGMWINDMV